MIIKAVILAGFAAVAASLAYSNGGEQPQNPPETGLFFSSITIQYDVAGNRTFRSKVPIPEINPDFPVTEDSTHIAPQPNEGDLETGPIDTLIIP